MNPSLVSPSQRESKQRISLSMMTCCKCEPSVETPFITDIIMCHARAKRDCKNFIKI